MEEVSILAFLVISSHRPHARTKEEACRIVPVWTHLRHPYAPASVPTVNSHALHDVPSVIVSTAVLVMGLWVCLENVFDVLHGANFDPMLRATMGELNDQSSNKL